ncbi:hypothetical protein R0137_09790 [Congregibacter brevis]|uniref:Uncharacterized protein n=1 Tax=Congregibacter brevis TaxID=3081201 RepID=A0ABZ0I8V0_9GAMM|nr:hypothetical protein R0137_09790 [Congregibacter sp. IMCC45268]
MSSDRVTHLLTLAANIGVIFSIGFLVLEMQQTSAIATAEVRLEYSAGWRTVDEARQDESFSELITKSIEIPEELSLEEFIRLDAYYTGIIDQMLTAQTFRTAGLVDGPFVDVAENIGAIYFSNEFARSWWGQVRTDWSAAGDTDFMKIVDEAILAGEPGRARRAYESIKAEVAPHVKSPKI